MDKQKDRHGDAKIRFSQFCEGAYKRNILFTTNPIVPNFANCMQMKPNGIPLYIMDTHSFTSPGESHDTKPMTGHLFFPSLIIPF
jgi:hypothetical protein